jgi:hypothetical protein
MRMKEIPIEIICRSMGGRVLLEHEHLEMESLLRHGADS